jgi:aspartate/methionine/tyrosine aminotransferase
VFSRRASWDLTPNELSLRVAARRARGLRVLDLADANPTHCGLAPREALRDALAALAADPASARYQPDPRGEPAARAAIAAYHGGRLAPEHVVLTAGTSEGYAHLFRLLADPGDRVHLPTPGYPLFEHLAALEGVEVERYPLRPPPRGPRWRIDLDALAAGLGPRSRALLVIHPHNPTGSFVDPDDWAALRAIACERGLSIVSDEVFADYGFDGPGPRGALAGDDDGPLRFVLSGASKLLGLPQLKLAWIALAGPAALRDEALARLEFTADAYLSVSPLLARALPGLLARRGEVQRAIRERVAHNRARLEAALRGHERATLVPAEAGWAALLRVAGSHDEEAIALGLLERSGVLVQPGFLFELGSDEPCAHLVLSLLPEPADLAGGVAALLDFLADPRSARS